MIGIHGLVFSEDSVEGHDGERQRGDEGKGQHEAREKEVGVRLRLENMVVGRRMVVYWWRQRLRKLSAAWRLDRGMERRSMVMVVREGRS